MHSIGKDKRGTSLVEILVVMVVLLVGIMTIIQMFPTGFRLVRVGESKSIAMRLAQQEIERWKSSAANLPDAIVPIDETGKVLNDLFPGPPFKGWTVPGPDTGRKRFVRGSVYDFRQIYGETTTVPAASYFSTGGAAQFGSRYTLAFSPIEVQSQNGLLTGVSIKGGDMRRTVCSSGAYPNLRPGNYGIAYGGYGQSSFYMTFPSDNAGNRVYSVSYSYWTVDGSGNQELQTVLDQPVSPTAGPWRFEWVQVNIPAPPAGSTIVGLEQSSDTCARGFVQLPPNGTFSQDPYEFKLADPIIGVIAFNPCGHDIYEYTALGQRPLQARISYRRYDPRIIREDKVVPKPPSADPNSGKPLDPKEMIPMKMSLRFILALGDPTDDPNEETYEGLMVGPPVNAPVPVYIVDVASGLQVPVADIREYPQGQINYKVGIIYLPQRSNLVDWNGNDVEYNVPLVGRQLRFYYRADGDWTVQCQKACSNYTRIYNEAALTYNSYALRSPNRLLFAPCQGEQTVAVDFTYGPPGLLATGGERRVSGFSAQIQQDTTSPDWFVDLPLPKGQEIKRVSVVGTSFRARVIWRDGSTWRHEDLDTTLVRQ